MDASLIGLRDATRALALDFRGTDYDEKKNVFSARVELINKGHKILKASFKICAVDLQSELGVPRAIFAATSAQTDQPIWDVSEAIPADGLKPGAVSKPFTLAFQVSHFHFTGTGDAVSMKINVYVRR